MILSVDDGCASDVRIAELSLKYKIETIFYWPVEWQSLAYDKGYAPLTLDEAISITENFEIGAHTITHRHLTKISTEDAKREIRDGGIILEYIFNQIVNKFCPPRGYTNPELTEYTLLFYESQRLTKGENLVHIHPDSGANNNMPWREYYGQNKDKITEAWCHSWELDKFNLWDELEEWMKEIY
jgi:peptidoglycan/xylan/chitin deacetylase (PgdA/CDA1 family)